MSAAMLVLAFGLVELGQASEWGGGVNVLMVGLPVSGLALIVGVLLAVFKLIPER